MKTTDAMVALVHKLRADQEELDARIQSARRTMSVVELNQAMEDIAIYDYIDALLYFIDEKLNA